MNNGSVSFMHHACVGAFPNPDRRRQILLLFGATISWERTYFHDDWGS